MNHNPLQGKPAANRNVTWALRGLAVVLLLTYVSLLVGARFA
jgi:hypothetical protein